MKDRRRIGRDIWALSFATFINRATGFLGLFAAIFFSETGMTATTVVIALLIVGVAGVSGSLIGGQLADRFGKIPVLLGSTLANVVLFAVLAMIDFSLTWWVVGISATSVLASQAFIGPASALVAQSADGRDRVSRFAFYRIFINVGSIVAPALVGLIGRDHFDTLFWFSTLGSLLVPLILIAVGKSWKQNPSDPSGGEDASEHDNEQPLLPAPRLRLALPLVYTAMALTMVVYAQHQSAVPLRLDTEPNGVQLYSLLLIINPVIVIAVEYPLSYITKRMPAHIALILGVVIMGVGVTITGSYANVVWLAIGGWVLFSIGECIFAPMSNSYVADLSTKAAQSRSQGRLAAFQSVGAALGPGIGSWMLLVLASGAWLGFLAMTIVSAVLVLAARAAYTKHAQEATCQCYSLIPSAPESTIIASSERPTSLITLYALNEPSTAASLVERRYRT